MMLHIAICDDEPKDLETLRAQLLEAAQELGISVQACSKRMQRARKKIRDFLEKME